MSCVLNVFDLMRFYIVDNFFMLFIYIIGLLYDCIDKWCYLVK